MKITVPNLDIVISRSCQLACQGCITFSDHNKVKGHTSVDSALPWLEFWASKLSPGIVHLFGGEPLMNPEFIKWAEVVAKTFTPNIRVQTNGIKLNTLTKEEILYLTYKLGLRFSVSVHNKEPWYIDNVNEGIANIVEWLNLKVLSNEGFSTIYGPKDGPPGQWLTVEDFTISPWVRHYTGRDESLVPGKDFNSAEYVSHHEWCEAKNFIQLYEGKLYKCPPMAVLNDTLSKYNYPNKQQWEPWLQYNALSTSSTDEQIAEWLETQKGPEKYCNMCFGGDNNFDRTQSIKIKYEKNN